MAWHARRLPLAEIPNRHVWLLDEVMEGGDGEAKITTRMRPQRGGRGEREQEEMLEKLAELGAESAWTTEKYPFMAFLMIGMLPMILIGDPVFFILKMLSLV